MRGEGGGGRVSSFRLPDLHSAPSLNPRSFNVKTSGSEMLLWTRRLELVC